EEDEEKSAAKTHCGKAEGAFEASVKEGKETFKCECIDCGHEVSSSKHCDSYKCPKCGGTMRRVERPGPGKDADEKGIGGSKNLPLDEGVDWDATAAVNRVRKWAGGPDKEKIDWNKYKQAFVWVMPDEADGYGGYKLPFADVIGDALKDKWGGAFRAMASVLGARGGVDLPDADRKKAYTFLAGYYKKFDKPVPDFKEYEEITDNVYVYQTEGHLEVEDSVRIIEDFKKVFGDESRLMVIDGGAKFGKVGELNFDIDLTEKLVDEVVERVVKAVKGIVRKEKVEVKEEDGVIFELEEPEEEETFELDEGELRKIVSNSFKNLLGKLD
ncbi:hypothetical protein KKH23_05755, partial [Patescibacteria group bacterium]|nr:hypothetical protein [Patescibacteria group bacterium]